MEAAQHFVPRFAIEAHQERGSLPIAGDFFFLRVPVDLAAEPQRDVRQVAGDRGAVPLLDIGDGRMAGLHAIQKIPRVQVELLGRRSGLFARLDPRLRLGRRVLRASGGLAFEDRDGVGGIDFHIGKHFASPARETCMLPLVPKNSKPKPARRPALASRSECTAVKPGYSNTVSWMSGVSPLSCRAKRPPLEETASGPATPIDHCTMSISCAPKLVIWPPE